MNALLKLLLKGKIADMIRLGIPDASIPLFKITVAGIVKWVCLRLEDEKP